MKNSGDLSSCWNKHSFNVPLFNYSYFCQADITFNLRHKFRAIG
ncbi:hypothetical protein GXM_07894 [Nostoc sphaeroides CCNUC1]|uniref:Uncharacterized protein n=1 Tax=Nostoc sphaeroides CCNUC1 TaxID=2653204 RepID=A0A5P8WCQ6_9NOSO|nr:hypothetical protein GXM_07894 [Nostoc sphaeroides CCNUC1]